MGSDPEKLEASMLFQARQVCAFTVPLFTVSQDGTVTNVDICGELSDVWSCVFGASIVFLIRRTFFCVISVRHCLKHQEADGPSESAAFSRRKIRKPNEKNIPEAAD